jgi:hypothetical protein
VIRQHHDHAESAIISDEQTANINNEWLKREQSRRGCDDTRIFGIAQSEIYDELKAKEIMDRALETLDAVYAFFKSLNMAELEGVLEEMEGCLKR